MTLDLDNDQKLDSFFDESETINADVNNFEISSENHPFNLSLRVSDIGSDKQIKRFINSVKTMISKSPEYSEWTQYIREVQGERSCKITGEIHEQTTVDIHHHPVSKYSIIKAVVFKYLTEQDSFCSADIVTKVLELHFQNRVGYCPLVKSIHEKFHGGYISIPMEFVSGDYKYFIENYLNYLDEEDIQTISDRLRVNRNNCGWNEYSWSNPNQTK